MKVLLPDDIALAPALPDGVEGIRYDARSPIPAEHLDAEVLVVSGMGGRLLADAATRLTNLRLIQTAAAGPDKVLATDWAPDVRICTGVGLHDRTVSEHAVALTLALVRQLPRAARSQADHVWDKDLVKPGGQRSLIDARVLIWGFGSIGQHLAPILSALGATVTGAARSAGERAGYPVVDDAGLADELARTDVLVMILPGGDDTQNSLDASRLGQLKAGAFVVNVGRGTTIDIPALQAALASGHVAGAALDVVPEEPLSADSDIWDTPGLLLTPHSAGNRPLGIDERIAENVRRLLAGEELVREVTRG